MLAYLGPSWPYVGLSWPILVPCWPILGFLTSIFAHLGPTWLQHGPNLAQHGPTWTQLGPTWLSNPRFLPDFEGHVGSQNRQKIDTYRKRGKNWFFDSRLSENTKIKVPRDQKTMKNRSKIGGKIDTNLNILWKRQTIALEPHVGSQNRQKNDTYRKHRKKWFFDSRLSENTKIEVPRDEKIMKNRSKNGSKIDKNDDNSRKNG